jgi:hypothetical protein
MVFQTNPERQVLEAKTEAGTKQQVSFKTNKKQGYLETSEPVVLDIFLLTNC